MTRRMPVSSVLVAALAAGLLTSCAGTSSETPGTSAGTRDVDVTTTLRTNVDAHIGNSWNSDSTRIANITDKFGPNETIYAVVDVPGKIEGSLRVRWLLGGTEAMGEQTVTLQLQEDIHAYAFRLPPPQGGHKPGEYTLEVYINDNRAETEKFTVSGG